MEEKMNKERDLCWLKKPVSQGIASFCITGSHSTKRTETLIREMPLLFEGIKETDQNDADILFWKTEDASFFQEGYGIES